MEGEELGERGQRVAGLAVDGFPEGVGAGGRRAAQHNGDAEAIGGVLHRVEEGAERLDVVADVRDEGDVGAGRLLAGERLGDDVDVADAVFGHALAQDGAHSLGGLDGDDVAGVEGEGEGVAPAAGADVEHGLIGMDEGAQGVDCGVALAARVGAEPAGGGRVEVAALGQGAAAALDLLAVAADAIGPGAEGGGGVGAEGVAHGGSVAHRAGARQTARTAGARARLASPRTREAVSGGYEGPARAVHANHDRRGEGQSSTTARP